MLGGGATKESGWHRRWAASVRKVFENRIVLFTKPNELHTLVANGSETRTVRRWRRGTSAHSSVKMRVEADIEPYQRMVCQPH
jgi:GDP-D-mannose dehydratase